MAFVMGILGIVLLATGTASAQVMTAQTRTQTIAYTQHPAEPMTPAQRLYLARLHAWHIAHLAHLAHVARLAELARAAEYAQKLAAQKATLAADAQVQNGTSTTSNVLVRKYTGYFDPSGSLSRDDVGRLWLEAGGPSWAEQSAENVAYCESGYRTDAYNPSGATGLWQILGAVVPGNLTDGLVNARNAVSKFTASGDTWAQWVCQP